MPIIFRWISLILLLNLLVACNVLPNAENSLDAQDTSALQTTGLSPSETVGTFLDAWQVQNFEAMYSLLSPRSAEIYPFEEFRAQYTTTHTNLGFLSISYTIHDTRQQGTSAAIAYDAKIETNTFGNIVDEGRTMRLVQQAARWAIAWSPMDIINGMTANVRLDPNRRFPPRGNIYDRNGLPLVNQNGTIIALYMRLSDMRNEDNCTELLSHLTLRPISYFNALYVDYRSADSVFFIGEMDGETYNRNRADLNNICGADIDVEFFGSKVRAFTGRTYFGHGAAAHITGYIGSVPAQGALNVEYWQERGYTARDLVAVAGIEFTFMDELAGKPDQSLRLFDSSGVTLRELGSAQGSPSYPVTLTIDRELQWNTAQAFTDAWNYAGRNWATRATGGAAVVMDVNSGAVLAMYSFPTYDPRIFYSESSYYTTNTTAVAAGAQITRAYNNDPFLPVGPAINNRAFTEQYAPGSTFKIFSTLAAADAGIWQLDELFDCTLEWDGSQYGDTSGIREDWRVVNEQPAAGLIIMSEALTTSCNPFFWQTAVRMFQRDPNLLYDYATQFGLGQRTALVGLSAEIEASGNIPKPTAMDEALNDVIGQGNTSVTAIQMAQMVSAVANGGTLYRPYLVEQVGGVDGTDSLQTFEPEVVGTLGVSDQAIAVVQQGMCQVPIDSNLGTAYWVFNGARTRPTYSSCGKTGTAEAINAPNAWYVAYAPAENPRIAVVVVIPNSREGSEVSAPIARRIMDHYFDAPIAEFPSWWPNDYIPLKLPRGLG
jgi:penicillin-binding protein 2